jgi:hypothetical protein
MKNVQKEREKEKEGRRQSPRMTVQQLKLVKKIKK